MAGKMKILVPVVAALLTVACVVVLHDSEWAAPTQQLTAKLPSLEDAWVNGGEKAMLTKLQAGMLFSPVHTINLRPHLRSKGCACARLSSSNLRKMHSERACPALAFRLVQIVHRVGFAHLFCTLSSFRASAPCTRCCHSDAAA